jgi:hypothetical protein
MDLCAKTASSWQTYVQATPRRKLGSERNRGKRRAGCAEAIRHGPDFDAALPKRAAAHKKKLEGALE